MKSVLGVSLNLCYRGPHPQGDEQILCYRYVWWKILQSGRNRQCFKKLPILTIRTIAIHIFFLKQLRTVQVMEGVIHISDSFANPWIRKLSKSNNLRVLTLPWLARSLLSCTDLHTLWMKMVRRNFILQLHLCPRKPHWHCLFRDLATMHDTHLQGLIHLAIPRRFY